jgi:hypothetical protein
MSILATITRKCTGFAARQQSPQGAGFFGGENPRAGYFSLRMKYLSILALLAVLIWGLNGCASSGTGSATVKSGPVPGEAKSAEEESRLAPGAAGMTPNASLKW